MTLLSIFYFLFELDPKWHKSISLSFFYQGLGQFHKSRPVTSVHGPVYLLSFKLGQDYLGLLTQFCLLFCTGPNTAHVQQKEVHSCPSGTNPVHSTWPRSPSLKTQPLYTRLQPSTEGWNTSQIRTAKVISGEEWQEKSSWHPPAADYNLRFSLLSLFINHIAEALGFATIAPPLQICRRGGSGLHATP